MTSETIQTATTPRVAPPNIYAIVWAYRKHLIIGCITGMLIGMVLALLAKPTFTSTATLLFPSGVATRWAALAGGGGSDLPSVPLLDGALMVPQPGSSASTAMMILQSRPVLSQVIDEFGLVREWKQKSVDKTIEIFKIRMLCKVGKNGELTIGIKERDPKRAYAITQALLKSFDDRVKAMGLDPAERNLTFIHEQAQQVEQRITDTQQRLLNFQKNTRLLAAQEQSSALAEQYMTLQGQLTAARLEVSVADRTLKLLHQGAAAMIEACVDPATTETSPLNSMYRQLKTTEMELNLLRNTLMEDHPDVIAKRQEVELLKKQLHHEAQRQLQLLHKGGSPTVAEAMVTATAARAKVSGLEAAVAKLDKQIAAMPGQLVTYTRLSAELEANLTGYKLLREEEEKARIVALSRGPMYVLLEPAALPTEGNPMGRLRTLIQLMVLGMLLAAISPFRAWVQQQRAYEAQLAQQPCAE